MLKLKLINKPKMMKLKCNFTFPNMVLANLQEKKATPSEEVQEIVADVPYDGLSKVILDKIPSQYIVPKGEIKIIKNGVYDVTEMASANVDVPEKKLGTKRITENGFYNASDDNLDGYSQVEVETSGVNINDYFKDTINGGQLTIGGNNWSGTIKKLPTFIFKGTDMTGMFMNFQGIEIDLTGFDTSNVTRMYNTFYGCINVKSLNLSNFNTSKVTTMYAMFQNCKNLIGKLDLSNFDTSKVTDMANMFREVGFGVTELDIDNFDMSNVIEISYIFYGLIGITRLKINNYHNLGKSYKTTDSANYYNYTLDLSRMTKLPHDDIMNVINGLYDIANAGVKTQKLVLGATNLAKLTSEEIAIATNKGWNVS